LLQPPAYIGGGKGAGHQIGGKQGGDRIVDPQEALTVAQQWGGDEEGDDRQIDHQHCSLKALRFG